MAFTVSLPYDQALAADDIAGSRAHVRGLVRAGVLSLVEADAVLAALDQVAAELDDGTFVFVASDEDIHTAVERRVTEIAGPAGAKLHTGRSRNDQVATDLRLFAKRELLGGGRAGPGPAAGAGGPGRAAGEAYLPGYTHLQRAQPVLLAHHLLAHGWALARDVDRLLDCRRRLDVSPLGAGALAGSSLPLDPGGGGRRPRLRRRLRQLAGRRVGPRLRGRGPVRPGHGRHPPVPPGRGDRAVVQRRVRVPAPGRRATSTGSSMLPQKKNPDIAELARGALGRLIGDLTGLLATLKGLPLAYNRDLQEDKEPLFDALGQVTLALAALAGLLATATFDTEAMAAAADGPEVAATDLAEHLVVGRACRSATPTPWSGPWCGARSTEGVPLAELVAAEPGPGPRGGGPAGTGGGGAAPDHPRRRRAGPGGRPAGALRSPAGRRPPAGGRGRGPGLTTAMGFHHEIAVRYGEVDQQGVVFNAHYLAYVDDAMDHWMRLLDADFESHGLGLHGPPRRAGLGGRRQGGRHCWRSMPSSCGGGTPRSWCTVLIHVGGRPVFAADMTYVGVEAGTDHAVGRPARGPPAPGPAGGTRTRRD